MVAKVERDHRPARISRERGCAQVRVLSVGLLFYEFVEKIIPEFIATVWTLPFFLFLCPMVSKYVIPNNVQKNFVIEILGRRGEKISKS